MRCKAAFLLIALACGGALAPSASAAAPIAPGLLVAGRYELPGFARAKVRLSSTTSPSLYIKDYTADTPLQAGAQLDGLIRMGFAEGVQATFRARHREAVSEAIVFGSAQGAQAGLQASTAEALASYEPADLTQSSVAGLPGAVAFADSQAGQPGTAESVFFATGRCLLTVSERVFDAPARAGADRAPLAGAYALSERIAHICA